MTEVEHCALSLRSTPNDERSSSLPMHGIRWLGRRRAGAEADPAVGVVAERLSRGGPAATQCQAGVLPDDRPLLVFHRHIAAYKERTIWDDSNGRLVRYGLLGTAVLTAKVQGAGRAALNHCCDLVCRVPLQDHPRFPSGVEDVW